MSYKCKIIIKLSVKMKERFTNNFEKIVYFCPPLALVLPAGRQGWNW